MTTSSTPPRSLLLADRVFRIVGLVAVGLILATIGMVLVGAEGWRAPFAAAHLAALVALVPLGIAVVAYAYRDAGGLGAMLARHARVVIVLALIAVSVTITLMEFDGGNRELRRIANFTTVGLVLLLIVNYLRWFARIDPR